MTGSGSRPPEPPPTKLGAAATLLVLAYAASILLLFLGGSSRVLTHHEVLVAEPARRMLEGGSWVVPEFAGKPRTNKPPAMSWLVAGSFALLGRSEWAARLPSALSGVALAWIAAALAARWFGRRVGLLAGLLQATTGYQLMQARLAEADMPMAAAVAAAFLCFAAKETAPASGGDGRRLARGFLVAAGLSFLLKWVGPAFLALSIGCFVLWTRRWRAVAFLRDPIGLALFAAALLAWPIAALAQKPDILDAWRFETLGRALGEVGDKGSPFLYFYEVPALLLPWLPYAVAGFLRIRHDREKVRFLACWVVPPLLVLTAAAFRSKHYAIPLLPPFTILAAVGLDAALQRVPRSRVPALVLLWGGASGALVAASRWLAPQFLSAAAVIGVVTLGLLATIVAERRRLKAGLLFATVWLGVVASWRLLLPGLDDYRHWADLARRTNAVRGTDEPVHLLQLGQAEVAFYLDRPVRRWTTREAEAALPSAPRPVLVLAPASAKALLEAHGAADVVGRAGSLRRGETEADRLTLFRLR